MIRIAVARPAYRRSLATGLRKGLPGVSADMLCGESIPFPQPFRCAPIREP